MGRHPIPQADDRADVLTKNWIEPYKERQKKSSTTQKKERPPGSGRSLF
jgi:hypothetical protein